MKKFFYLLQSMFTVGVLVLISTALVSCSSNDDEDDDVPEIPHLVKRMTSVWDTSFVYSSGKISQEKFKGTPDYDITYSESSIVRKSLDGDLSIVYKVENGLIRSLDTSNGDHVDFSYEDGRLQTWKRYHDGDLVEEELFEWEDDVIVHQKEYDYFMGRRELYRDYSYTYYEEDEDYGGAVACFQYDSLFYDDLPESLIVQGYFGKWPKYLAASALDSANSNSSTEFFTYILDDDGYPLLLSGAYDIPFAWETIK